MFFIDDQMLQNDPKRNKIFSHYYLFYFNDKRTELSSYERF